MFGPDSRVVVVVGAQWGDEGKGKLVDVLAESADWVVRYQGGANAGHTVDLGDRSFVLHQIPSGILHPGVRCAIGNGVVLDPDTLFEEIDGLVQAGIDVEGRLYVSERAHLVLPYHKMVDAASASSRAIGTTGRGIGPAYEDKVARRGVRVLDLRHPERLREVVEKGAENARSRLARSGSDKVVDVDAVLAQLERLGKRLLPLAEDVSLMVHRALKARAAILLEGAQAVVGVGDVVADEHVGDRCPRAEFDELAVHQPQPRIGAQRDVGDDRVEQAGLARAGLAPGEQVAVDQGDLDRVAVLVDAERHRVVNRILVLGGAASSVATSREACRHEASSASVVVVGRTGRHALFWWVALCRCR